MSITIIGAGTIGYTMFVEYHLLIEIAGFAILAVATVQDYQLRRWSAVKSGKRSSQRNRGANVMPRAT